MREDVLDKEGRIANPIPCLYQLVDGSQLFSEEVEKTADSFVFDLMKTARVKVVKSQMPPEEGKPPTYEISLMGSRIAGSELAAPFGMMSRRVLKTSVIFIDDVTDAKAVKVMRKMVMVSRIIT
jgi:hypothetical protein